MFVDEYQDMYDRICAGDSAGALALIRELDEMSRDDRVVKIESFLRVLLVHLIKRAAEGRTTHSWDTSIRAAVREVHWVNSRRKAKGRILDDAGITDALADVWPYALAWAADEVHRGRHSAAALAGMLDRDAILEEARRLVEAAAR